MFTLIHQMRHYTVATYLSPSHSLKPLAGRGMRLNLSPRGVKQGRETDSKPAT